MSFASGLSRRPSLIAVVDEDASIRQALSRLIKAAGYEVDVFANTQDFRQSLRFPLTTCLILDVQVPVQDDLNIPIPTIFITAQPEEDQALGQTSPYSLGFLEKPFDDKRLIALIEKSVRLQAE